MTLKELKAKRKNLIREYNKADRQAKKLSQAFTVALNKPDIAGAAFREIETASKNAFKVKAKIDGELLKIENEISRMKSKNPTIIKAKKISHIDVSKTHNPAKLSAADLAKIEQARGLVEALGYKRPVDIRAAWQDTLFAAGMRGQKLLAAVQVATKKKSNPKKTTAPAYEVWEKAWSAYIKASDDMDKAERPGRPGKVSPAWKAARMRKAKALEALRRLDPQFVNNLLRRQNAEHKDADHPINVTEHWRSGPPGYMSPWQRAAALGQNELFSTGIQLSKRAQELRGRRSNPGVTKAAYRSGLKEATAGQLVKLARIGLRTGRTSAQITADLNKTSRFSAAQISRAITQGREAEQKAKQNPGRGTRRHGGKRTQKTNTVYHLWVPGTFGDYLRPATKAEIDQYNRINKNAETEQSITIKDKTGARRDAVVRTYNPGRGTRQARGSRELERARRGIKQSDKELTYAIGGQGNVKAAKAQHAETSRRFYEAWTRARARKPKTRKANGAASAVKKIFEKFGGRASTKTKTVSMPNGTPAHVAKLGTLRLIKLKNGPRYEFKGAAAPFLAADHRGKLHVVGGRYRANPPGQTLGEIETIEYETTKPHLGQDDETIYFHHLGEETGERPVMRIDSEGLIKIIGGAYTIEADGIHN